MDMSMAERQKYAEIFSSLNPSGGFISGIQARQVFMNSGLNVDKLGQIWDICDIDKDGNMDFDEFSLAMRFIYASINGEISDIPPTLPPQFIPQTKMQYFGGQQRFQSNFQQAQQTGYGSPAPSYGSNYAAISQLDATPPVPTSSVADYDWYIAPSDRSNYDSIYKNNVQSQSGEVRLAQFEELYQALQIPRDDIIAAWSVVNVHNAASIGKEQCIMFFHILNSRRLGNPVPNALPTTLRASFSGDSNYGLSDNYSVNDIRQQPGRPSVPLSFATKSAFSSQKGHVMAGDYLSRLSQKDQTTSDTVAQEARLKEELEHIKRQVAEAERKSRASLSDQGDVGIATRELSELLAYKQQQVLNDDPSILERQLLDQDREIQRQRDALKQLDAVMQSLREQKGLLETHVADSESELKESQREITDLKSR